MKRKNNTKTVRFFACFLLFLCPAALGAPEFAPIEEVGKKIFFDKALSQPVGQSCASCHDPGAWFADPNINLSVSEGAICLRAGNRNAQSVAYAMFSSPLYFDPTTTPAIPEGQYKGGLFWGGRANMLEEQAKKEDGKIKIPSLRNCAITPPYTHNGYHQTLREVVVFNNTRDLPEANWPAAEVPETVHRHPMAMPGTLGRLGLTDQEIDDIVAFLMTLTDGYQPQ